MKRLVLKVHPDDNVLVALQNLGKGEIVRYGEQEFLLKDNVQAKHKFFTGDIKKGGKIIMYGVLVGTTQQDVHAGERMTTFNTQHAAEPFAYRPYHYQWEAPDVKKFRGRTFNGYHRQDG